MLVIGHRGAAGEVTENTLGSMRRAVAVGADGVEFDVRALERSLIVLHDDTLERTTNGHGTYKALSLAELRRLQTANGEAVPLLEEVLALVGDCALVNVEVKEAGIADAVIIALESFVAAHPQWRSAILLSSFDEATSAELARQRGNFHFGVLYHGSFAAALQRASALGAWSIHMPLAELSAEAVRRAHANALQVYVYTVNDMADMARCAACAVDGIFSDFPARALAHRRGPGERRA